MNAIYVKVGQKLTEEQRKGIVNTVATRGHLSGNTVYRYLIGGATPQYLYKVLIVDVINEVLNTEYTIEDLWPDK